jgi:pentatricopeptide repeat protein
MAVLYPYPSAISLWVVSLVLIFLLAVTVAALLNIFRRPYYLVGWLWFLGALVPFLGIIQGGQWPEMADRYAYLPEMGLFITLSWGGSELFRKLKYGRYIAAIACSVIILTLMVLTWIQVGYWKDSTTLFSHGVEVNPGSYMLRNNLGTEFLHKGEAKEAADQYLKSLDINPGFPVTYYNLGLAYSMLHENEKALEYYAQGLKQDGSESANVNNAERSKIRQARSRYVGDVHNNMGTILAGMGRSEEAMEHFRTAIRINPLHASAHVNLGKVYQQSGRMDEAVREYSEALRIRPYYEDARKYLENARSTKASVSETMAAVQSDLAAQPRNADLHFRLGDLYRSQGEPGKATEQYQEALRLKKNHIKAMYGLVTVYSQEQNYEKALQMLRSMREQQPGNPDIYYNMACIYAKQNRREEAVVWLKESIEKGFSDIALIDRDPDLTNIRETEYVKTLLKSKNVYGHGSTLQKVNNGVQ